MIFPESLNTYSGRPVITFTCLQGGAGNGPAGSVTLPAPIGLQISDQANYGGVELGALGGIALNTANVLQQSAADANLGQGLLDPNKLSDARDNFQKSAINAVKSQFTAQNAADSATALAVKFGGTLGKALGIARGVSLNPNVTTEFTGTGVRSFSFQYKLVPSSKKESTLIGNMVDFFRVNLYPEGEVTYLKYPSKWRIAFQKLSKGLGSDTTKNLPKFGECYLSGFSSTYNSGANAFFEDGAPMEVDISLSFTETKAYTKEDIQKL